MSGVTGKKFLFQNYYLLENGNILSNQFIIRHVAHRK